AVHRRFRLFQGHASPGVYARAFLEGRLSRERLENFDTTRARRRRSEASPTTVVVAANGTGIGALIGQFSFTQVTTVNFSNNASTGPAQWIAANGDSIYTAVAGAGYRRFH